MIALRWLALVGLAACSGARPGPGGTPDADADGDGYAIGDGDCDDGDAQVHPDAADPPGDGIDQDCDDSDTNPLKAAGLVPGDLVITEIFKDPLVLDGDLAEWFEVKNATAVPIDLEGLLIRDDLGGDDVTIQRSVVVEAGARVVLGAWTDPELNGGAPVAWSWGGEMSLSNTEDQLVLVAGGAEIDAVRWDASFPNDRGRSMNLEPSLEAADANDGAAAWCSASTLLAYGIAGYGSPGAPNEGCAGDLGLPLSQVPEGALVITEIMKHPSLSDGDDGEWFEIANTLTERVNLAGLVVTDGSGASRTVESLTVEAGGLLLFGSSDDSDGNGGLDPDWIWEGAFGLSNADDVLILSFGTRVYDEVAWDNGGEFPDVPGAALSLDPDAVDAALNDDGASWCAATDAFGAGDLGTPGAPNPQCP